MSLVIIIVFKTGLGVNFICNYSCGNIAHMGIIRFNNFLIHVLMFNLHVVGFLSAIASWRLSGMHRLRPPVARWQPLRLVASNRATRHRATRSRVVVGGSMGGGSMEGGFLTVYRSRQWHNHLPKLNTWLFLMESRRGYIYKVCWTSYR